jgi:hypothetical protein
MKKERELKLRKMRNESEEEKEGESVSIINKKRLSFLKQGKQRENWKMN